MEKDLKKLSLLKEIEAQEILKNFYGIFAKAAILRSIPDVRDGLKISNRRILLVMFMNSMFYNKKFYKSAKVIGEVVSKLHPHGNQSIYAAIVRMAQSFNANIPLLLKQGNFGSIDGDEAAAERYTEVKLSKYSEYILYNIFKADLVEYKMNFDNTIKEACFLPSLLPNLLLNGSLGIGVALMSSIPSHNFFEVIDVLKYFFKNNLKIIDENIIFKFIKGPDFPTGGVVFFEEYKEKILKGKGTFKIEGILLEDKKYKNILYITEIPYQVNKSELIKEILFLKRENILPELQNIIDESNSKVFSIKIILKNNVDVRIFKNKILKYTNFQRSFSINFIAIKDDKPISLNLVSFFKIFIEHLISVVTKDLKYDLKKFKEELNLNSTFKRVLQNINAVIRIIKSCNSTSEAILMLKEKFSFDKLILEKILKFSLSKLNKNEIILVQNKIIELQNKILFIKNILKETENLNQYIFKLLEKIYQESFKKKILFRKTTMVHRSLVITQEDLIENRDFVYLFYCNTLLKILSSEMKFLNVRKSIGKSFVWNEKVFGPLSNLKNFIIFKANNRDTLLGVTNFGRLFRKKILNISFIPFKLLQYVSLNSYLKFLPGEYINFIINENNLDKNKEEILILTEKGKVLKIKNDIFFSNRSCYKLIKLSLKDKVVSILSCSTRNNDYLMIFKNSGKSNIFNVSEIRLVRKNSRGVTSSRFSSKSIVEKIVSGKIIENDHSTSFSMLIGTKKGFFKKFLSKNIKIKSRGLIGNITIKLQKEDRVIFCSDFQKNILLLFKSFKKNEFYYREFSTSILTGKVTLKSLGNNLKNNKHKELISVFNYN